MKVLNLSGGSTKGASLAGMAITLLRDKRFVPNVVTGVSIGAALALPLLLQKYNDIEKLITTITLEDIFDNIPVTKKGKLSVVGIKRFLCSLIGDKVGALGTQGNFKNLYKTVITPADFYYYIKSDLAPIYVGVVDINIGVVNFINVKLCTYLEFIDYVMASTSIPLVTELVEIKGSYYTDGGVAAHIGSKFVVDNFSLIEEMVNCFSRPKEVTVKEVIKSKKDIEIVSTSLQIIDIQSKNNSKLIEDYVDLYCNYHKIKNTNLFTPYLTDNLYETNPTVLLELFKEGVKEATKNYN